MTLNGAEVIREHLLPESLTVRSRQLAYGAGIYTAAKLFGHKSVSNMVKYVVDNPTVLT
ncbi:MAG: hypothetical protein LBI40_03530 [Treponema sp.]|jgi:hypothetical protein|nr:hypothetical protein [Treponema sp.]